MTVAGILKAAKPIGIICTRDRERATAFYRDVLELTLASEDPFAAVFEAGGITIRVSAVPDWTAHEHTVMGFAVADIESTVRTLNERGVSFTIYPRFKQDALGIWTVPGGQARVAWFNDPDGNVLSLTQFF